MSLISRQDGKPSEKSSSPVCVHCASNSRKPLADTVGGVNYIKNREMFRALYQKGREENIPRLRHAHMDILRRAPC